MKTKLQCTIKENICGKAYYQEKPVISDSLKAYDAYLKHIFAAIQKIHNYSNI